MNFLQNLQLREKILVIGAAVAVVLALLYTLVIDPMLAASTRLDRQIRKGEQDLKALYTYRRDYQQQKQILDSIDAQLRRQKSFALFSRLEEVARNTGTRNKIDSMKPTTSSPSEAFNEESVEVRMEDVTLEELKQYLYQLEQSPQFVKVKRLYIKPRLNDRQRLSVTFRVSTFTPKDNAS
jgi:type II secretory pathway component PulM